jgi:hypothetical protein
MATTAVERLREGRPCEAREIIRQIGALNLLGVSGGRWAVIRDSHDDEIGVRMPCGTNREIEVILSFWDTYIVRRYRTIVKGERRGQDIMEFEAQDVYCTEVGETVWQASIWR